MTKTNVTKLAEQIADLTLDAYSRDRYTNAGWVQIARRLLNEGATQEQAIWILESKHTRWAADAASRRNDATAANFDAYVNSPHVGSYARLIRVAQLELGEAPAVAQETGADLAGNCEGEDIAELIDLARLAAVGRKDLAVRAQSILARIKARR